MISQQQPKRTAGVAAALAVSIAAVLIAVAPVVMLVVYAKPVLDTLSQRNAAVLSATVKASDDLPTKYAAPYLLPQYFQEDRGTCWDFAAIGVIEQSYRAYAISKGYMSPNTYVRFSQQAFGISMIKACHDHPDVCDVLGDYVFSNHTEGGEVWWLYSLKSVYDKVLPLSVCPYTDDAHDKECPGMDKALAENPVKFNIRTMETAYNVDETKKLMVAHNAPLAWSSMIHDVVYYYPCDDEFWADKEDCSVANRVRCPTDRYYNSEYCARHIAAMFDMDGTFMLHGNTLSAGGHAMNVVGYNDEFVTKQGYKGGFIIKNSWHDIPYGSNPGGRGARGSHSVAYWMQQISAWDERALCPGVFNPDNWLSCVSQAPGPTMGRTRGRTAAPRMVTGVSDTNITLTCLSETFMNYLVNVTLQPTEFVCANKDYCSTSSNFRWFLASSERNVEQDLMKACMLRYDVTTGEQFQVCTPYLNPSHIAYIWQPIKWQQDKLPQDLDFCGYYFWPYEVAYKQLGLYVNLYSTYFDFVWDEQSFLANAPKYPSKNYDLVKMSTGTQKIRKFDTPSPFPKQRYD